MRDPQVQHRGLARPGPAFGSPFHLAARPVESPAPTLGQHTRQVLQQAGFSDDEIHDLQSARLIKIA